MRYIDSEKIYEATEAGRSIFEYYYPGIDFSKPNTFVKIRNSEKTASARIVWYNNSWRITDFGNKETVNSMRGIEFVKYREELPLT